jgi:hypothetical protein
MRDGVEQERARSGAYPRPAWHQLAVTLMDGQARHRAKPREQGAVVLIADPQVELAQRSRVEDYGQHGPFWSLDAGRAVVGGEPAARAQAVAELINQAWALGTVGPGWARSEALAGGLE